jgi:hypothetical protein
MRVCVCVCARVCAPVVVLARPLKEDLFIFFLFFFIQKAVFSRGEISRERHFLFDFSDFSIQKASRRG